MEQKAPNFLLLRRFLKMIVPATWCVTLR